MNAISKVLVVLVLVLSVAFAVSQMVLHGKREHFGKLYLEQSKARAAAEQQNRDLSGKLKDLTAQFDSMKARKESEIQTLKERLSDEEARANELTKNVETLTLSVQMLTDRANKLETELSNRDQSIEMLRNTVAERDKTIQTHRDKIENLEKQLANRDKTIADLNFQLNEQKKAYVALAESEERLQAIVGELVARGIHVPPAPLPIINGRIIRVDTQMGVAVVDKGSKAGVKPNTQFTVYNEEGYVAKLIVHDVQNDVSAGRLTLVAANKTVKQGDKVTTEIP